MQGEITANGLIVGGMIGQRGAPGVGIKKIEKTGTSGLIDTYTITYTNGTTFQYQVANGAKGDTGNGITKIEKTGTLGLVDTYTITYDNGTTTTYEVTNGEKGETGATPDFSIGSVTKGDDAEATITGTAEEPILNLVLPAGNGIASIEKTGTAGLVDTYTITFTDETTFTYNVTNGADGNVTDVQVEGTSVVDNGVANITGLATQAELDRYKTIYNVLPKVTGEGETLTLNNTGESILELSLKGNTSQTGTPTPDSPIPINVVSGDNEIVVCGKNLCNKIELQNAFNIRYYFNKNIQKTITISTILNENVTTNSFYLMVDGVSLGKVGDITGTANTRISTTITFSDANYEAIKNGNEYYLLLYKSGASFTLPTNGMIENGNSMSDYEPYQSQTYPINLTCKNLFDKNGLTYRDGYYLDDNGVEQSNSAIGYTSNIKVQPSTQYTIQGTLESNDGYFRVYYFDSTKTWISRTSGISMSSIPYTFTTPNNCYYVGIQYQKTALDKDTIQLEKGSQATSFQPYTTPIELNAIGNYKDGFARNTGKNLFDINNLLIAGTYQGQVDYYSPKVEDGVLKSGGKIGNDGGAAVCVDIENIQNVAISFTPTFSDTTSTCQIVGVNTLGSSATTTQIAEITLTNNTKVEYTYQNSNYKYIGLRFYSNTQYGTSIKNLQVEIGSQPTSYEPYGTGQWCKYNAIKKIVLNGSESWGIGTRADGTTKYFAINNFTPRTAIPVSQITSGELSDKFIQNNPYSLVGNYFWVFDNNGATQFRMGLEDTSIATATDFKNWLSNNITTAYIPLATPYLSLIEDETLIEQLDNIQNAMSYEGQTNVVQVNNDKPFIIDGTALRSLLDYGSGE